MNDLPPVFQPPAADPDAERHVREAARERLRHLLHAPLSAADGELAARTARRVIREEIDAYNRAAVMANRPRLPEGQAFEQWIEDAILHYGLLSPLLRDSLNEEIFCDGPDHVSVVRGGRQVLTALSFDNEAHLVATIKKLAADAGRRIDEASPLLEARLPGGARVHAVLPPIARPWPYLTIRNFPERLLRLADLCREETFLTEAAGAYLVGAIRAGANVLIVGGTGAGKSTLLNAVLAELPGRTVIIEETAELQIVDIPFAVALEGRPPNVEGAGEITLRPLVKAGLRMRPRRIVLGESRGSEAFDLLQAMNTGHPGSLTTAHANSPRDGLERLVTMAAQAGERLPDATLRRMVAQTISLVVYLELDEHGQRAVQELWELVGMEGERFLGHAVFERRDGRLRRTGLPSRWTAEPRRNGVVGSHGRR